MKYSQLGGGNWITENFPTYNRHFWKSKILVEGESRDMFRDATDSERNAWLKKYPDGNVVPQPTERTPLYEAAGAVFNPNTGYYELNGLLDITEEQMAIIYNVGAIRGSENVCGYLYSLSKIRTNLPSVHANFRPAYISGTFTQCLHLEVVNLPYDVPSGYCFARCPNLHTVTVKSPRSNDKYCSNVYSECPKLVNLNIFSVPYNLDIDFRDSPLLSLDSFKGIVEKTLNSVVENGGYSITVHQEVYAKLTDETNIEWHKVLTDALAKNIRFITV